MNNTNDLLKEPDAQIIAVAATYAPDNEPERTNEELIRSISDTLADKLGKIVELCGVGKCVLHNKTFTLKLELSPSDVVIEDFLKERKDETK